MKGHTTPVIHRDLRQPNRRHRIDRKRLIYARITLGRIHRQLAMIGVEPEAARRRLKQAGAVDDNVDAAEGRQRAVVEQRPQLRPVDDVRLPEDG